MEFRDIRFGKASAEAESASTPDLLVDGYLDAEGITERALDGGDFLFLGYKGSGKTALAEHLKLRAARDASLFVTHKFLSAFPYRSFQKIVSGSAEPETKYPTAWTWILLLLLLDSFVSDNGATSSDRAALARAVLALRKAGLLPAQNLHDLVVTSSKRSFKVNLPFDLGFEHERGPAGEDVQFLHLVENLERLVIDVRSESRHLVIIDGLDDILSERDVQYQSLAALITESMRINNTLRPAGVPAKFLVLCRTDLYERLPGPNKNKIRQDYATEFDWYHDPRDPAASRLSTLANLRARLAFPAISDLFHQFFPREIDESDVLSFLLLHTRHTPRDFLQLLGHIQAYSIRGTLTRDQVLSGIRDYSISYFFPEIKDELVGYTSMQAAEAGLRLVSSMGRRDFSYSELCAAREGKERYDQIDLEEFCEVLYECSAIGHIERRQGGSTHFSFKFRNRHSAFSTSKRILLHRGIWKAMNLA